MSSVALVHDRKTNLKVRNVLDRSWASGLIFVMLIPALICWILSGLVLVTNFAIIQAVLLAGGATGFSLLPGFFLARLAMKRSMLITLDGKMHTLQGKWANELAEMIKTEESMYRFVFCMERDELAFSTSYAAWTNIVELCWDACVQYRKMLPYISTDNPVADQALDDEFRRLRKNQEQARMVADKQLTLSIRSNHWVHNNTNLEALTQELTTMVETFEELDSISNRSLGAGSETDTVMQDIYTAQRSHTDSF